MLLPLGAVATGVSEEQTGEFTLPPASRFASVEGGGAFSSPALALVANTAAELETATCLALERDEAGSSEDENSCR